MGQLPVNTKGKLIVLWAFDKDEDGALQPAFEPREMPDEDRAIARARIGATTCRRHRLVARRGPGCRGLRPTRRALPTRRSAGPRLNFWPGLGTPGYGP